MTCTAHDMHSVPASNGQVEAVQEDDGQPVLVAGQGIVQCWGQQLAEHCQAMQPMQGDQGLRSHAIIYAFIERLQTVTRPSACAMLQQTLQAAS